MNQGISMRALQSDATEAVIDIIGVIGWEVEYDVLKGLLRSIPESVGRVVFEIYSPGGGVFDGNGIIQEIGELSQRVHTVANVQVAASMATLIAVACDERTMAKNGRWLIHNPWSMAEGDAAEMEKTAEHLRATEIEAAEFYASRCNGNADEMLELMAEEKWIMADEAMERGFIGEINDPFDAKAFAEVKAEIKAAGKWPTALAEIPEDDAVEPEPESEPEPIEEPAAEIEEDEPEPEVHDEPENDTGAESESEEAEVPAEQEPADDGKEVEEEFSCECIKCGHTMLSKEHCAEIKCPECGGQMRRAERPGPGRDEAQENGASYDCGKVDGIVIGRAQAEGEYLEEAKELTAKVDELDKLARKHQAEKDKLASQLKELAEVTERRVMALRAELEAATEKLSKHVSGSLTFEPTVESWEDALVQCDDKYEVAAKRYPELLKQWKAARQ